MRLDYGKNHEFELSLTASYIYKRLLIGVGLGWRYIELIIGRKREWTLLRAMKVPTDSVK